MARYADYPTSTTVPGTRKWLFWALLLSLGLHVLFFVFAYWKRIDGFSFTTDEKLAPPQFVVKQVTVDPKTLDLPDETRIKLPTSAPKPQELTVPSEKPEMKEIILKPSATEVKTPLLNESPKPEPINWDKVIKTNEISAGNADKEVGAIAAALLKDSVRAPKQPIVQLPPGSRTGDGADAWEGIPGRRSLDDALSRTGPLPAGGIPIAMPGGALFDYDKADLRGDAVDEMQKLGELIRRNPKASFRIEGHTDSVGSREYNLELSLRRAQAVKNWLTESLGIDPSRIETIGFGPDKLLVSADKSIDDQQPNRRVEIVIKTNRK
ncbi:MAG TPA: OmpA family protein [Chthoniobacteraceae bacterium]|nr:OmpA family protein [Chthoniobacteraceae bacterium]